MDEKELRNKVIRLAHSNAKLRPHLLPLLREGAHKESADWIQDAVKRPGRVRKYLGIPDGETIPASKLNDAIKKLKDKKDKTKDEDSMLAALNLAKRFKDFSKKGQDSNIPDTVKEIAQDVVDKGADESLAHAVAWSVYCKYKEPGSPHCHRPADTYFPGRG